jgi:hypothetical protein
MTIDDYLKQFENYENTLDYSSIIKKYKLSEEKIKSMFSDFDYVKIITDPIFEILNEEECLNFKKRDIQCKLLPLQSINASATKLDDGFLIVLNKRLLALIFSWSELQYINGKRIKTDEKNSKYFAKNFAPIMDCYLTPNSGNTLPLISFEEINQEEYFAIIKKTLFQERFIYAHELAHILLGHMDNEKIVDNYRYEMQADIQAITWMKKIIKNEKESSLLFLYIEVFVLFHYIECNEIYKTSYLSSHPSALIRLVNIYENLKKQDSINIDNIAEMISSCLDIDSFKIIF